MPGTAIVLIPDSRDEVWKVSSEKIPHMTLLYLGDQSNNENLEQMFEYIRHVASTTLMPLSVSVDHRGNLGGDNADVLFFNNIPTRLINARQQMLKDDNISKAYSSADQYSGWTPHLTLGYPQTPARGKFTTPAQRWPSYVTFDKLAVWTGNFEGPTYTLTDNERDREEVGDMAQADEIEEFLAHHGIKGMKWGVRRDRSSLGSSKAEVQTKIRPGKKVVSRGGKGLAPSEDAVRTSVLRSKAKASSSHALSNKELKELVERMNLEQNYSRLADPGKLAIIKRGTTHAQTILAVGTVATTAYGLAKSPLAQALNKKLSGG